jgi:hypothetical protein
MTIAELIAQLEAIRADHGDLTVLRFDEEWGPTDIEKIGVVDMFALRFEGYDDVAYTLDGRPYLGRTSTPIAVVELR